MREWPYTSSSRDVLYPYGPRKISWSSGMYNPMYRTLSNVLPFPMESFDIVLFRFKSEDELQGELLTKKKTGLIWTKLNSWSN